MNQVVQKGPKAFVGLSTAEVRVLGGEAFHGYTPTYFHAIRDAGCDSALLHHDAGAIPSTLDHFDGVVVAGVAFDGADVNDMRWVDEYHEALIRAVLARRMPLLCICYGAQVLNTALGGSLKRITGHCPEQPGTIATTITVGSESRLRKILGAQSTEQCMHNWVVDEYGTGVTPVAMSAAENVVEAFELDLNQVALLWPEIAAPTVVHDQFAIAVQFHPDRIHRHPLLAGFGDACRAYMRRTRLSDGPGDQDDDVYRPPGSRS